MIELDLGVSQTDLERLIWLLRSRSVPCPYSILASRAKVLWGLKWSDRKIRAIAAKSNGRVIGTASGYSLNENMTEADFREYLRYYRGMFIAGLSRLKKGRDHRYGKEQLLLDFIREGIWEGIDE